MRNSTALLVITLLHFAGIASADEPVIPPDNLVYCTVCHGVQVKGNHVIQAPRLSGMEGWYVQRQLFAFGRGWRGTHEQDIYGMEMEPMAPRAPGAIRGAVDFVSATKSEPPPATIEGDVVRGRDLYATCSACHAADGSGVRDLGGPSLTVTNDWYLVRQLQNFKAGVRGDHPDDTFGAQMRAAAQVLSDDEAIRDVVAYINSLQPR
jgi:cytochrome c oxidase subunit 2